MIARAKSFALAMLTALATSALLPIVSAEVGNPTVPDAVYDASTKTWTSGGNLAYLDTRDVLVTNVATSATVLWLCDSAVAPYKSAMVDAFRKTVTFTSVTFVNAGGWSVRESCSASGSSLAAFSVASRDHYEVLISFPNRYTNSVAWSADPEYMTITVLDRMNARAPVGGADIVLWRGTAAERVVRTDANGFFDTEEPLPGAGSFVVEAYKNTAGDPSYETYGRAVLPVIARGVLVTRVGDPPLAGYESPVTFDLATSARDGGLLASGLVKNWTVTLTHPDGTQNFLAGSAPASDGPLTVNDAGQLVVSTTWRSGSYALNLRANAVGTVTDAPEWVQTWLVFADLAGAHDLVVAARPGSALAGAATDIDVVVSHAGAPFAADVYLLTEDELFRLHAGTLDLRTIPAERVATADEAHATGAYRLQTALELAHGPYAVHAREPGIPRHDNAGSEPFIIVDSAAVSFHPGHLAFGLQHDVPVEVRVTDAAGRPLDGVLRLNRQASTGSATIVGAGDGAILVRSGVANIVVDPLTKGALVWDFEPAGSRIPAQRASGMLFIDRANFTISPAAIPLGSETAVQIHARDLSGAPLVGLVIELCGQPFAGCSPRATTNSAGLATVSGAPVIAGTLAVRVNGVDIGETVEATSRVAANIVLGEPTIEKERVTAGQNFAVRVPVTNNGQAAGLATLALMVDGLQAAQQTVEVPAGQTVNVMLTAAVDRVGTYSISVAAGTATKGGLSVTALPGGPPEDPSIPGFEAVFALGALAAVAVLLGRRFGR